MNTPFLDINNISKTFGGVRALTNVSLSIESGEIHGLCGENGAGKSTLIKVLGGSVRPETGSVTINGQPLPLGSVPASEEAGIAIIHQESAAFPHLDTYDNVFVGREIRRFGGVVLDRARMKTETATLLARLEQRFDPRTPVGDLQPAQRQMVAIARALSRNCRLMVMDEPTASLSTRETGVLFRIIRQLKADGVSVIYVSHRLEEVFELADRVTVLRDGRKVDTVPTNAIDRAGLIRLMVGRDVSDARTREPSVRAGVVLDVDGLTRADAFTGISFQVRAGEVVALTGLVGAGRSEVARAIFGVDGRDSGTVTVNGRTLIPADIQAAVQAGIALVPEDRQRSGLAAPMSVKANLSLAVLKSLARVGIISDAKEDALAVSMMNRMAIKAENTEVAAETLSGGNQQKVVLGKWLAASPRVLILDEPTRGIDVGAKAEVYDLIGKLADGGTAILLISSELPEVLRLSDRIIVMRSGRISGELPREEATQERILSLAMPEGAA